MSTTNLYIIINGEIFPANEAVLTVSNRAFCYGDGLFETIHALGANIQFVDEHFERLLHGMQTLRIEVGEQINQAKLTKEMLRLINRNKLFGGVRIRLAVFRDSTGLFTPENNNAGYVISCQPLAESKYELNQRGLNIGVYSVLKKPINMLSPFKTSNGLNYVMAAIYCKEQNFDDCLILNENGQIIESYHSNLFLVKGNSLFTPPVEQGCTNGVMRKKILQIAPELGLKVSTNISITEALLAEADEIFLTNAIEGIRWVMAYKNRRYYNKTAQLLCQHLNMLAFGK